MIDRAKEFSLLTVDGVVAVDGVDAVDGVVTVDRVDAAC